MAYLDLSVKKSSHCKRRIVAYEMNRLFEILSQDGANDPILRELCQYL